MKKVVQILLLSFLVNYQYDTWAQSVDCSCKADSIQLFSLDKEEYNFSFTNVSQGLCFTNVIYETSPKIIVKIINKTQDTIINLYRERDAHILWLRKNGRFDTIYPGQAMILKGLAPGGKFIGSMNTSPIYLKYQIKDSIYNNTIYVCGNIYPTGHNPNFSIDGSFKDSPKQSSQQLTIEKDTVPKNGFHEILYANNSKYLTEYWNNEKLLIRFVHPTHKFLVIDPEYPKEFDTIPFITEETYFGAPRDYEFTLSLDDRKINREFYVDGRVIERYNHGGIYSKKINKDSTSKIPFDTRYHRNGKIWFEFFDDKNSIEYYATGEVKWTRDNKFDKLYFRTGKLQQITYKGPKAATSVRLTQYLINGCKQYEWFAGGLVIFYDSTKCNCPLIGSSMKGGGSLTYFNCLLDSAISTKKFENYTGLGEFDLNGILKNGSETYLTYYTLEKLVFYIHNYNYAESFDLHTCYHATQMAINFDLILPYDSLLKITFNQFVDGKKEGIWINLDPNIKDLVERFSTCNEAIPRNYIYRYPQNIYKNGQLLEIHYFSENGTLIKKDKYLESKTLTENYTYEVIGPPGDMSTPAYCTVLNYVNGDLANIASPRMKADYWSGDNNSSGVSNISIPFSIQSGEFVNQKLLNGTIEYYNDQGYLIKITIVKDGIENTDNTRLAKKPKSL
jgi:hypothetical protein